MPKQNDKVLIDGVKARIETFWGQGKHTVYKLDDGRVVFDISDDAIVADEPVIKRGPAPKHPYKKPSLDD
jgi:hypothetical protein